MTISTDKLSYDAQTNTFTGEASDLGINGFPTSVVLWNPKTNGSSYMDLDKKDMNDGELAGCRYSSHQGYKLLIIND